MKELSSKEKEFKILYDTHYNQLCRSAYRIVREKESAREVVQHAFVELWKYNEWNNLRSPLAYLYVTVYHESLKVIRRSRKFTSEETLSNHPVNHSGMETEELEIIISTAIDNLPEKCRAIFLLSREEEMTYKQIAMHLGLSVKTIENQMGIALMKLRHALKKECE